ncbi:hypothetical protein INR49_027694 [Caranx melampygus]|nr:hypothetical protein INR49_027694 [Caranx melampygus]
MSTPFYVPVRSRRVPPHRRLSVPLDRLVSLSSVPVPPRAPRAFIAFVYRHYVTVEDDGDCGVEQARRLSPLLFAIQYHSRLKINQLPVNDATNRRRTKRQRISTKVVQKSIRNKGVVVLAAVTGRGQGEVDVLRQGELLSDPPSREHCGGLGPVGDGPAHHTATDDHYVGPLRWEVRVELEGAPAAPWQRVRRLLPHGCQLGLQI